MQGRLTLPCDSTRAFLQPVLMHIFVFVPLLLSRSIADSQHHHDPLLVGLHTISQTGLGDDTDFGCEGWDRPPGLQLLQKHSYKIRSDDSLTQVVAAAGTSAHKASHGLLGAALVKGQSSQSQAASKAGVYPELQHPATFDQDYPFDDQGDTPAYDEAFAADHAEKAAAAAAAAGAPSSTGDGAATTAGAGRGWVIGGLSAAGIILLMLSCLQ